MPYLAVSAFSDESWGGDLWETIDEFVQSHVSAFSDESWGGDQNYVLTAIPSPNQFQHSLMNLGVETLTDRDVAEIAVDRFSIL